MRRPAPRQETQAARGKREATRRERRQVLLFLGGAAGLFVLISLVLDAWLAWILRARLAELRPVPVGASVRVQWLGRWDCKALTGRLWWLPILPQTRRLELPHGLSLAPEPQYCPRRGYAAVWLIRAE